MISAVPILDNTNPLRTIGHATILFCAATLAPAFADAEPNTEVIDSITVPDSFTVTQAADSDLSAYPMFMTFDDRGRLFIAESSGKDLSGKEMAAAPECVILCLEDDDGDGEFDRRTVFADKLSLPMGVLWHRNALFVASPPDLVRLEDTDDDGVADAREVLLTGWNVLNTASLHGPFLGPDGWLYLTHGRHGYNITTKDGAVLEGLAARIWRCRPDGTGLERYCGGGFDNPVELIFTNAGDMIGTMTYFTDPRHGQRDALMHWVYGGVYPKPHDSVNEFVRTGGLMPTMTKFARIAPAGLLQYRGEAFGDEYKDVLFSAQFNPHRVMSHRLIRDGATFRTEDADFLTSTYPDFYPTDVLEDADGSLLVSDTGAWYVDACPISRVAKPEIKGGIYRIRKDGYTPSADPWGHEIDWIDRSNSDLVALLGDPRVYVRDRAFQALAQANKSSNALRKAIANASTTEARVLALRAVVQSDETDAVPSLIDALSNDDGEVRTAAIRALGNFRAKSAVDSLARTLESAAPHERTEAASALGRIGAHEAAPDLLAAAEHAQDRFEEHAIIYALIELGDTKALAAGLESGARQSRKAALIALDQLGDPSLRAEHAVALLESGDDDLRDAGLWVASRHPDWAEDITGFVQVRLTNAALSDRERAGLSSIVGAYSQSDSMQEAIAKLASDDALDAERRSYVFELIAAANGPLPERWSAAIGYALNTTSDAVRSDAIGIVRQRGLAEFDAQLESLVIDSKAPRGIRIAALDALISRRPAVTEQEFALVESALAPEGDTTLRSAAARILTKAELSLANEIQLISEAIPSADALLMTGMLTRFDGRTEPALGHALVAALSNNPTTDRLLTMDQADRLFGGFPDDVRAKTESLRERLYGRDEKLVARFLELEEQAGTGDVGRGRRIFYGDRAVCATCHAIGNDGGNLGPDLTTIGLVRSAHDLLEAILFPSASIVPDYTPFTVETGGDIHAGIIAHETSETINLRIGADEERIIARGDVLSIEPSPVSIMPEGLDAELSDAELLDLLAFLQSLNNEQWLLPERREE